MGRGSGRPGPKLKITSRHLTGMIEENLSRESQSPVSDPGSHGCEANAVLTEL